MTKNDEFITGIVILFAIIFTERVGALSVCDKLNELYLYTDGFSAV